MVAFQNIQGCKQSQALILFHLPVDQELQFKSIHCHKPVIGFRSGVQLNWTHEVSTLQLGVKRGVDFFGKRLKHLLNCLKWQSSIGYVDLSTLKSKDVTEQWPCKVRYVIPSQLCKLYLSKTQHGNNMNKSHTVKVTWNRMRHPHFFVYYFL